ncbi:MAG TPA: type VI secretion system baseplate subunit TssK [Planctomycetes bacterium]|nr:type VI secretion system baseplate subunit TssK [Planctomycetota bacterium]
MAIEGQIHWCEGLFLQPHHLQSMQKHIFDRFTRERKFSLHYPYGVIEARISDDELENMRVCFDRLRAIMPSGIEVNVPDNADLPSLDIKEAFASTSGSISISLGVPVWYASRGNVVDKQEEGAWRSKRTYRVAEIERTDENTGENPQPIPVRRVNARLLLDGDDRSDIEVLPLLKIVHATGEDANLPRRDPAFIPPCMLTTGSPVLQELARDLTSQIMASRNELVLQINRGGFSIDSMRGVQFEQVLRLRTLNHYSAILSSLTQVPTGVSPFEIYVNLRQLLAELAALRPDRDQFEVPEYNHDNPAIPFNELSQRIRSLLRGAVAAKFLKVAFTKDKAEAIFRAELTDEVFSLPNEYFLAIKTKEDPRALAELVLDRDKFKLMPRSLANQRIFGVKLSHEPYPPVELPAQVGLHYFRLIRAESARIWERIKQEKAIAAKWPGVESSDFDITLYMTVPDVEAKK